MLKRLSYIGYSAALATGPALLTACSSQPAAQAPSQSESPSVLFSVTSDAVHFENQSGMDVTMVMDGVDPEALWFTDRPARESGVITTTKLANEWAKGGTFDVDPPNAALVLHEPTKTDAAMADTLVATVRHATYDAAARSLTTSLHVLTDEEARNLEGNLDKHGMSHDRAFPLRAGTASLFIDSVSLAAVSSSSTPSASAHTTPSASPKPSLTPSASQSSPAYPVVTTTFPDGTVVSRTVQPTTPYPIATLTAPNGNLVTRYETPPPPPASPGSHTTAPMTCVQAGTCTVDTSKAPVLKLEPTPTATDSYTYNSTLYFQMSISPEPS